MQTVILAAGRGSRLRRGLAPEQRPLPKPLIPLTSKPLLLHVIDRLHAAGIRDVVVVTGFGHQAVHQLIGQIDMGMSVRSIHNSDWTRGNGLSLFRAHPYAADEFLLVMADHVVDPHIYRAAVKAREVSLCVDYTPSLPTQLHDATRVLVRDRSIQSIGKQLTTWNGIDTGIFSMSRVFFPVLARLARERQKVTLSEGIRALIESGQCVRAVDVSGAFWSDIDTIEDLQLTETLLRNLPQPAP